MNIAHEMMVSKYFNILLNLYVDKNSATDLELGNILIFRAFFF